MAATTSMRRIRRPFVFSRASGSRRSGRSFVPTRVGRVKDRRGCPALWPWCRPVSVSLLTLLVIDCYPLTSFHNQIERLESSTGGTFELTDAFVDIHLAFQLDPARIYECHLTINTR